jgi:hypothetical protein
LRNSGIDQRQNNLTGNDNNCFYKSTEEKQWGCSSGIEQTGCLDFEYDQKFTFKLDLAHQ